MSRARWTLDIPVALHRVQKRYDTSELPPTTVRVTRTLLVASVWVLSGTTSGAAVPVSPQIAHQRYARDSVILAADRDRAVRDRSDVGGKPGQIERPRVECPHSRRGSDRSVSKAALPAAAGKDSMGNTAKEHSKNRKTSDADSRNRSAPAKGRSDERERTRDEVEYLAMEARQAEMDLTLRAADLALAEERYRAGQITRKDLERARTAHEDAQDRAATAHQFFTAAQARLADLRNRTAP